MILDDFDTEPQSDELQSPLDLHAHDCPTCHRSWPCEALFCDLTPTAECERCADVCATCGRPECLGQRLAF